ncbi:phosphotransferase [Marinomonas sp. M1K-6]|uniref:Phosphotransferase n=1 Tax=Marinomonas profundi TaxID=2726122 RepID=A0A847RFB9_9GAMM|nr:phosphotransferase [Marinomonas profundi]NLQ18960.1 phosphotransferase [Marinomonas profundi]UDV02301.1 phosphotransferase [Marinomonas profundi]
MTTLSEYFVKMAGILPTLAEIETTLLEDGFSNKVYLIHWHQIPRLVLRIPSSDASAFGIDRSSENAVLLAAVRAGISPPVLWHDDQGAFACQFVSQPSLDWAVFHQDKEIPRLAQALVQVHSLPMGQHHYDVFDVIEHYLAGILFHCGDNASLLVEYDYLSALFRQLTPPDVFLAPVLCHNDLNPKNILMDSEQLWLIDWEYAGVGDPLFDLAVVVKSHNLDARQTTLLLHSYRSDLPEVESLKAIQTYVKAYGLREMAWLLLKHLVTPEEALLRQHYDEFKATPGLNPFHEKGLARLIK